MKRSIASLAVALGVSLCGIGVARADRVKLVVVVAKGSAVTNVARTDLKSCYLGERVTVADKTLVPFNAAPSSPERTAFDAQILGMSPDEVGRFWVDRKVRGQSPAPRSLPSAAHVAKVAAKFPNAVGYLAATQLTADVQPVAVDGIPYTDARYGLTVVVP